MGALSAKTVLLVTHQVDFLPAFDSILVCHQFCTLNFLFFLLALYVILLFSCNDHKFIEDSL